MKLKIFILVFVISSSIYSQINIDLSVGKISSSTNTFLKNNIDYLALYWEKGFALNIQTEYFLIPSLAVSPSVEFATYKFYDYFFPGAHIPEDYVRDATGQNSNQWNLFLALKFFPPTKTIVQFVFITGIGFSIESLGVINATFGNLNGIEKNMDFKLKRDNKILHLVGLSLRFKLLSNLSININGSYYSNYNDRFYPTIKAGIIYNLVSQ